MTPEFVSSSTIYSGLRHYGLISKRDVKWVFSKNEAIKRDKAFLSSYVEKRAIPWQFSHSNVKYTMTCAMDTVLMTIYLLWFRRHLPPKIPYMDETTRDIIRCIDNGDHARARYVFVMTKMKTPNNFTKAKPEDIILSTAQAQYMTLQDPFRCFGIMGP